jgi:MoxR-like ATPase
MPNTDLTAIHALDVSGNLPPRGAKVWITGFAKDEHAALARLCEQAGYVPTPFTTGASAVLAPSPAPPGIVEEAARTGKMVLSDRHLRETNEARARRTALDITDDSIRILDVELPRRQPGSAMLLPEDRFANLCLDVNFLSAARTVARGAKNAFPTALEGTTATSKTTAVLWVGHLCRQPCVRLNLQGQTDTGELIGKFVPNTVDGGPTWRFAEGVVPEAMRKGHWVVLDELNLALPEVLERLNPVLEMPPSLILSENLGERFGMGGDIPINDFRIFATMNGSEYSGRSVLSPAFRDRFTLWTILDPPAEAEYRALLFRLVHGVQPSFVLDGIEWMSPDTQPVFPGLDKEPGIDTLLERFAAFHAAVSIAAGGPGGSDLGRARRERYVFSRRTMQTAMTLFAEKVSMGIGIAAACREAIEIVYVSRVAPGPDRAALRSSLRAVGLAA